MRPETARRTPRARKGAAGAATRLGAGEGKRGGRGGAGKTGGGGGPPGGNPGGARPRGPPGGWWCAAAAYRGRPQHEGPPGGRVAAPMGPRGGASAQVGAPRPPDGEHVARLLDVAEQELAVGGERRTGHLAVDVATERALLQ